MIEKNSIELPFKEPEFIAKWEEWLQYRKERRLAAYQPTGLRAAFSRLKRISQNDWRVAVQVIDQSLENNWQGLFELKPIFNGTHQKQPSEVGRTLRHDKL